MFVKLFVLEVEPFLTFVGLVMGTDNRGLKIEIPDLVIGYRFHVLIVDLDESVSYTIGALVHEIVIGFVEHHLVVDDMALLGFGSITTLRQITHFK